jgi:acyl-CoA reductase-like NAD-dependent aldehyde dehydrogenase
MAATAVFYNSGQTCTAGTRLLVEESIHDEFMHKVIAATSEWIPGDPLDPKTTMGPLIDKSQCNTTREYIDIGLQEGAQCVSGGDRVLIDSGGYYHQPTIFTGVDNQMRIAREEVFGPVMSVIPFKTQKQAIEIANDSIFGLAGAVWSKDISKALTVAQEVIVGTMGVNNYFGGDITVPFGGFKQSGNGRDKSMHAFDDYTELKTTWIEY